MKNAKELNFPHDYIYEHRRVFSLRGYNLFVFYKKIDELSKQALLSIFEGQSVHRFLTDEIGWRKYFELVKPEPIGFQLYSTSTVIAASINDGKLSWSYQYHDDSTLSGKVADPLDADVVEAFCDAAKDLDEDVLRFVIFVLHKKSRKCSIEEKEARRLKEEKARLEPSGDLGPIFRGKREEDE